MLDKVYVRFYGESLSSLDENISDEVFLFPIGVIFEEEQLYQLESYHRIESLYQENASHTLGPDTTTSFMIVLHDTGTGYLFGDSQVLAFVKGEQTQDNERK